MKAVIEINNCDFSGKIIISHHNTPKTNAWAKYKNKNTVTLIGAGAHRVALVLIELDGNCCPWKSCSEHNREWYCPDPLCNIDMKKWRNIGRVCRHCQRTRPSTLMQSMKTWERHIKNNRCIDSVKHSPLQWWKRKIEEVGSSGKILMKFKKESVKNIFNKKGGRLWAVDLKYRSGAKCFLWSIDLESFLDIYLSIPPPNRHAYEVIPPDNPCRMAFDLDMYIDEGINAKRDGTAMMNNISE